MSSDLEFILWYFKDQNFKELINDVYPILKIIIKFNSEKNLHDYSFRNILTKKINVMS